MIKKASSVNLFGIDHNCCNWSYIILQQTFYWPNRVGSRADSFAGIASCETFSSKHCLWRT